MGFEGVAEAHQLMLDNKHLGKISILVGAESEGARQDGRGPGRDPRGGGRVIGEPGDSVVQITGSPTRSGPRSSPAIWLPAAEAVLDYGARGWAFLRSSDDPQEFIQLALFDNKVDFDRYWYSPEISECRTQAQGLYHVPLLPIWLTVEGSGLAGQRAASELNRRAAKGRPLHSPPDARGECRAGAGTRVAIVGSLVFACRRRWARRHRSVVAAARRTACASAAAPSPRACRASTACRSTPT